MRMLSKILFPLVLAPSVSYAAGMIDFHKINQVAFFKEGFLLYTEGDWNNPNSCQSSKAVVLTQSDPNYDKAYSLLLAAYMSGKEISSYSDGCINVDGTTFNKIRGFKYLFVK